MKNRLLQLAAVLALVAVLGKFYAVPLIAQVRAAVVKNIDERGRIPYMVQASCTTPGTNQCTAVFPAVAANKRFVAEYLNGNILAFHSDFSSAYLDAPSAGPSRLALSTHFESTNQVNYDHYAVTMPVVLYYEAGQTPVAHLFYSLGSILGWETSRFRVISLT